MQTRRAEVLLAGAIDRSGLAVVRSLGRHEVPFVVVGDEPAGMVAASRHVRDYVCSPPPQDADGFFATVLDAAAAYDVRLVIPMTDTALAVCNRRRDSLPSGTVLAAAPVTSVENVLAKRLNLETARRLGIPCPAEFRLESNAQVSELVERLGFPIVLKNPGFGPAGALPELDFKWLIVRDQRELDDALEGCARVGAYPIFQEFVEGPVHNLCCFAAGGRVVAMHEYSDVRRIAWAGLGVLRETTDLSPELAEYARALLQELQWEGVAHLAFIVRDGGGDARYMETNGRFWGSIAGSIRVGWDFPWWTYRYFTTGELPTPPPLEVRSRNCWHYGDLRLLWRRIRGIEPPRGPRVWIGRAIADYLSGFRPGVHSDVFRFDDPLPALVEHFGGLASAVGHRLERSQRQGGSAQGAGLRSPSPPS